MEYLHFSVILRPWVLVRPRESNPRPSALQSSSLQTELILPKFGYIFVAAHISIRHRMWTDTLWKGTKKPVPVVHISAVWGSFWGQSRDDYQYQPCYWCFSLETCLKARISGFSISEQSDCLFTLHLSWSRIGESGFQERQHSAEAVPRHKNGAKGNSSCLNLKPVQYGIRYPVSGIRYPVWFLRRNDNPVYCALVSV